MKTELLGVPEDLLREHTAVSEPVAEAMARGARLRTGSTYALSVTGIAGPGGATEAIPVGAVFAGLAGPQTCRIRRAHFLGDRDRVRALASSSPWTCSAANSPGYDGCPLGPWGGCSGTRSTTTVSGPPSPPERPAPPVTER